MHEHDYSAMSGTPDEPDFSGLGGGEDQQADDIVREVVGRYNAAIVAERRAPVPDDERIEKLKAGREAVLADQAQLATAEPEEATQIAALCAVREGAQGDVAAGLPPYGQGPDGRVRPADGGWLHAGRHQGPGKRPRCPAGAVGFVGDIGCSRRASSDVAYYDASGSAAVAPFGPRGERLCPRAMPLTRSGLILR
ncbi:hypothetical protein ABZ379_46440 [Streptomyces canus]|uniref:hypothetical protein n=1 Tax=Streptomyces canus TaxID=58343 RepID=UPI0033DD6297